MMIKVLQKAICERVLRDAEIDDISLIGLYDSIATNASQLPLMLPGLTLYFHTEKSEDMTDESLSVELRILLDEQELYRKSVQIEFRGRTRNRLTIRLQGLPIPHPGLVTFRLFHNEIDLDHLQLEVLQNDGEPFDFVRQVNTE